MCSRSILAVPQIVSQVHVVGAPSSIELESRAGEPMDPVKLQHDVKTLWQTGRVGDVTVEARPDGDAVQLFFQVRARRSLEVRKVQIEPPTPGVTVSVAPGTEIDLQQTQQVAAGVRKQLETSGFPNAAVESRLAPVGAGKADLKIHIDKGEQVDVGTITFSGNLGVPPSELRHALRATKIKTMVPAIPGVWKGWHLRPGYNQDAVESDVANLRSFYFRRGYFDVDVRADPVHIEGSKARIEYAIDSGPHSDYSTRAACRQFFRERRSAERVGVLDFTARLDVSGRESGVIASTERGPSYRINRIEFRGNRTFRDSTLRRSFLLSEGDLLDQTMLRKSLGQLNRTGLFQPLTPASVVVNTPPDSDRANVTVWLKEKKVHSWLLSGPVGPMSIAGPLQFAIGTRLPAWGQGILELSTFTLSANLMLFAKPVGELIPFLPHKRFLPLLTIQRPVLPGQPFFSGITIAPQLGWQGMLLGYGASKIRNLTGGISQTDRAFQGPLPVTIVADGKEKGTMNCEVEKTKLDWARQIAGTAVNFLFSFSPL
jgi:hypothetical protein